MRKIFNTLIVMLMATAFVACSSDNHDTDTGELDIATRNLEGNWKLQSLNGEEISGDAYFYIALERKDTQFKIYDNIESGVSHATTGTYTLTVDGKESIISGVYDNSFGRPWNNEYIISRLTANEMEWTTVDSTTGEVQTFVRVASIPENIVNGTRSITE